MLIMHFIFLPSHENCACCGNGNSENVAKTYGSLDTSKSIQANLKQK